jgi:hypothetical protein
MKAIKLLEQQHRHVNVTFGRIDAMEGDPAVLARELANDLAARARAKPEAGPPAFSMLGD